MNVSVFGLGYVGAVSCACFADAGHNITGVDVNQTKVDIINSGKSPIVEDQLQDIIEKAVKNKNLKATTSAQEGVMNSDLSLICVGTPSHKDGSLNLDYVFKVCKEIGLVLKDKSTFHTVAIRSTVLPGTVDQCAEIIEQASGKKLNKDFGVASNPEFLREGTAIKDFYDPPYTVIGASCKQSEEHLREIYKKVEAPFFAVAIRESEMIKYANNSFHALKITFANEIGNICKELDIDSHTVMDMVCNDTKLNLSPYYMKSGFAFGGSCLPKDVRAIHSKSRELGLETPVITSMLNSNKYQIQRGLEFVYESGKKKIGILGFSFKAGTDDLRESPIVTLIETLLGKGYDLKIFDKNVAIAKLVGANKEFIENAIPHISNLMVSNIEEVLEHAEVIVIGNKAKEFKNIVDRIQNGQMIIDLVRIDKERTTGENYVGICW